RARSSHSVSRSNRRGVGPSALALWTRISIGPTTAAAAPAIPWTARLSATSAASACASPPSARMRAATDSSSSVPRATSATRAPRGMTQQQMARVSGLPRATWANLESGSANPTLAVLHRVAAVLQITLEELLAAPRAASRFHPRGSLPERTRTEVTVRQLLPDPIPGAEIARMEFSPLARLTGIPHTPGTREYLTCESGRIELLVAGEKWLLQPGDGVSFRGDQRHSYANPARATAARYAVVLPA